MLVTSVTLPPIPNPTPTTVNSSNHPISSQSQQWYPGKLLSHPTFELLNSCTTPSDVHQVLPQVIKQGFYTEPLFQTKLVALFSNLNSLREAMLVFDPIPDKPDDLYHTLLKGHAKAVSTSSSLECALGFLCRMKADAVPHVVYNFTYLLKACGDRADLCKGMQVHAQLVANGFSDDTFAMTAVVNLYAKCHHVVDARRMFDRMPSRDLVAWNTMVAGYAKNGMPREALEIVRRMQYSEGGDLSHRPNSITLVAALPACADLGALNVGRSIHSFCVRAGFDSLVNISTAMLDMYAKCGAVGTARLVFDRMRVRNVVSWNSMIDGYAENGEVEEAICLFDNMLSLAEEHGVQVTEVAVMAALNACGELTDLERGASIHKLVLEVGLGSNVNVVNCLITMYSKCKRPDLASQVFDGLRKQKTAVSWNAMISGFAQNGRACDALNCFSMMISGAGIKWDSFTVVSVAPAVADMSVLRMAKWIHGFALRLGVDGNPFVVTALVDAYAKCGGVHLARRLFDSIDEKHVTTWNAMIDGYGTHGMGQAAVKLFEDMKRCSYLQPNDVTFLCVLSACSHSGLVSEGKRYLQTMEKDYGLVPASDHYGAAVDLLGRAGLLDEAWEFIQTMPIKPGVTIFGAMLGACKIHKNVHLAEKAAERLFELEPEVGGYHVLLANIYASASLWEDVARVRKMMESRGLQKAPGCTFIEVNNEMHTFYSGMTNHLQAKRIYGKLEELIEEIKAAGYVADTDAAGDVDDDLKVQLVSTHSEKLAIAFGLINTRNGATIQIRKNLRVCTDCHNATKYISLVTGREIIVRDMSRFHHFKNGSCSCGDYW